ncbi:MAG: DUF5667 domain-containing protein [Actinomycetes bacterium]
MSVLPVSVSPTERRRAQEFAELLEGSRSAGGHELESLVSLAATLRPARITARPDFRAALRATLVAQAAARTPVAVPAQRTGPDEPATHRLRRLVAAGLAAGLLAGAGAAAASTRALPGDSLYGIKRGLESVELTLAHGDLSRGRALLEQADTRLSEAEALAASEDSRSPATQRLISTALTDMDAATRAGAEALNASYTKTGDSQALVILDRFVMEQRARLADLADLLSPTLRDRVTGMTDLLGRLQTRLEALLGSTGSPASAFGATGTSLVALSAARESGDGWAVSRVVDRLGAAATGATGGLTDGNGDGAGTTSATGGGNLVSDLGSAVGEAIGGLTSSPSGGGSTGGSTSSGGVIGGSAGTASVPAVPRITVTPPLSTPLPSVAVPPVVVAPSSPLPAPSSAAPAPLSTPTLPVGAPSPPCVSKPLTPC